MIADGLFERFGRPDIVLGQHVAPIPAGVLGVHAGAAFAASDALRVRVFGRGGHGSRPEATVDPVVLAAAIVLRLQTIVSRELAGSDTAVVSVGSIHAGTAPNIIPEEAELELSIRTVDADVRERVLAAIERIVRGEAIAAGAEREPLVESIHSFPAVVNDAEAAARVCTAFGALAGVQIIDPGAVTGSEDVGEIATAADAPCMSWLLGGADPELFVAAQGITEIARIVDALPSNHSPAFAPVLAPTLPLGVAALRAAARAWLAPAPERADASELLNG